MKNERWLSDARVILAAAPPHARQALESLLSTSATERLSGLESVAELASDPAAVGSLLALGTLPRYPQASAILLRSSAALATVDAPPRALPTPLAEALVAAYERDASALLRVARTSRDPESARAAARIVGHIPGRDAELEPLLVALLSGAADAEERGPLLYHLARVQLARGGALHPRAFRALEEHGLGPERVAAALAFTDAGVANARALETIAALDARRPRDERVMDPRVWGRRLPLVR